MIEGLAEPFGKFVIHIRSKTGVAFDITDITERFQVSGFKV
jgi:hypothetical protein